MLGKLNCIFYRNYSKKFTPSVNLEEIQHFSKLAKDWWNENGTWKPLHSFNKCRIPWIRDRLTEIGAMQTNEQKSEPMKGLSILEIGCGGGILSEPLSRLGCIVTGLDPSEELINLAKYRLKSQNLTNLQYVCSTIEEHASQHKEKYDAVVISEVIEHITEKEKFVKCCVECLKSGGSIFVTTPNKTWISGFCVIFMMESVLKLIPPGTHHYDMFIHVDELRAILRKEKCETISSCGIFYNPFTNNWFFIQNQNFSYALHATKFH